MGQRACPACGGWKTQFLKNVVSTPMRTVNYEGLVGLAAQEALRGDQFVGPTRVELTAWFQIPKTRAKKLAEGDWHTQRPDTDNIEKSVLDGLNGIAWADDSLVCSIEAVKRWTTGIARVEVTISDLDRQQCVEDVDTVSGGVPTNVGGESRSS
jgi:Holliday junction resolvase RusA-like endonuclease